MPRVLVVLGGVVVVAIVLAIGGSRAHAMGSDVAYALVAWNHDGTAALLRRTTANDGDHGTSYVMIAVGVNEPIEAQVSMTTRAAGRDDEVLDAADCAQAAERLQAILAAQRFVGVRVDPDACRRGRARVVTIDRATARLGTAPLELARTRAERTPRARLALAALATAAPIDTDRVELYGATGKLALVFTTCDCGTPARTEVTAYVPSTRTNARLVLSL